jgi:hypothetical protein
MRKCSKEAEIATVSCTQAVNGGQYRNAHSMLIPTIRIPTREDLTMRSGTLICVLFFCLVMAFGGISPAQCNPTMPSPNRQPIPTPTLSAPAVSAPVSVAPTATANFRGAPSSNRGARNPFGNVSSADAFLQSLGGMSPMAMVPDLASQQAALVQQRRARVAVRRAMREPARARMREQNAYRYYEAGMNAESAGRFAAARKYYRRAANIDGSQFGQDAQQALSALAHD